MFYDKKSIFTFSGELVSNLIFQKFLIWNYFLVNLFGSRNFFNLFILKLK